MKKILSAFLVLALLCSMLMAVGIGSSAASGITVADGWFESLYAQWKPVSGADGYSAYYTLGNGWVKIDESLIRTYDDYIRVDAVGLVAGSYKVRIVPTVGGVEKAEMAMESGDITVMPYDRSGFAHFNYTAGVGAYNDDGSLKKNAIVLYVTDANKDTVTVTSKDGTTVRGIGNILNSVGMDVGGGKNSKGGLANTNSDILRKLAKDGTPLVIRIVGRVTAPAGLTQYNGVDYGGSVGDNGYMARMSGGKDITIEGIGSDAVMDGWGLHFICQTADYAQGLGKSFEVRNIAFQNVPEDCVGMEGQQEGSTLTAPVERCWIHHCTFYAPVISNPAESDKDGGDGACDFKRGQYFTNSYCYYNGYHKTNLVGSSDDSLQYHISYHHNYWKDCESRGPLARQANIHMYNNIFEGQTSYCMNPRANAYIFSEYNLFFECKNPVDVRSGAVKSYNDSFSGYSGNNHATVVTDKSAKVSTSNKYANFDTDPSLSYIPSGSYQLQESISEMKAVVMAYAGHQKDGTPTPAQINTSVIPANRYPASAVSLDYSKSFNSGYISSKSGTVDNIVYSVSSIASTYVKIGGSGSVGCDIVFYVGTDVNITVTETSDTSNHAMLCRENGEAVLVGSGTAYNLPAGFYFIQSSNCNPGKTEYKEVKLAALAIQAVDPDSAENPMPTPPPVDPDIGDNGGSGDNGGNGSGDNGGNNGGNQGTTIPVGSYTHNITENGTTDPSGFFKLTGSLSTGKGEVSFAGLTLSQCLKLSSSASVKFTAPADGKVTLVFNPSCAGYTLKVNGGDAIAIPSDGLFVIDVSANTSYEVLKGKSESFLYYLVYTPNQVHVHDYSVEEIKSVGCTEDGEYLYTCSCGDSYTETVPAFGHNFVDGFCVDCNIDDPDYIPEEKPGDEPTDKPIETPEENPEENPEDEPKDEPKDEPIETPDEENKSPENPENPDDTQPEDPEEKLNFFQLIWKAIMDFFKALFGIKE